MTQITLSFPEDTLSALEMSPERFGDEIKLAASVKLYELRRLSCGAAAELAGLPQPVFLSKLAEYGVPAFRMTEEELREDKRNA